MKVPLLDLNRQYNSIKNEIQEAINRVLDNTNFIMGQEVKAFEEEMAKYCEVKHAIGLASGTDALLLALRAMGVGPGDEVIVPTFTFFATAGAVSRLGATPVFADIDPVTFNIDVQHLQTLINDKTKVIIPVHLYGQTVDMDEIRTLAERSNIGILEDGCQAVGAKYRGIQVGNLGDAATLSFFPSKNLGAYGDAGMLLTNNDELADLVRSLRVHGAKPKYYHKIVGYNSRLDTIQAAILSVKLKYLPKWTESRRSIAHRYHQYFEEAGLLEKVSLPLELEHNYHIYHQYVIQIDRRDDLQKYLAKRGIGTSVYYPLCLHLQECFKDLKGQKGDLPVAEKASERVLALPIYPELTEEEIKTVVFAIKDFYTPG